ncbi:MAG TPA: LysE family translocator [Rubrobacter sp.]|nr:LysE family translocator [Rubrobacter sp.]
MPDASTFALFVAAALVMLIVPGPSVLYIVARSVEGGRTAGFVSVLGVQTGALVHIAFATLGLSAILASSAVAFSVVKWLGAAYLIWLGLRRIFGSDEEEGDVAVEPERLSRVFSQGVIVNTLNPKTALFFLAFLPQFVDPSRGAAWAQILLLGATFVILALCSDGLYALLSGTAGGWLRRKMEGADFRRGQRYVSGGVLVALGAVATAAGKD